MKYGLTELVQIHAQNWLVVCKAPELCSEAFVIVGGILSLRFCLCHQIL